MASEHDTGRPLDDWFEHQILPHERALTAYLRRAWPNPSDILDLRQETYCRVYESAARNLPVSPGPFLLATARNLVVDRVRRERVVSIDFTHDVDSVRVQVDDLCGERQISARQELRNLSDALDSLPARCRTVVWLRRVEGLSQKQVAARLGLQEGAVSSHLSRGLKALTRIVLGNGLASATGDARRDYDETEHG